MLAKWMGARVDQKAAQVLGTLLNNCRFGELSRGVLPKSESVRLSKRVSSECLG